MCVVWSGTLVESRRRSDGELGGGVVVASVAEFCMELRLCDGISEALWRILWDGVGARCVFARL
jgi:hypothetical protein